MLKTEKKPRTRVLRQAQDTVRGKLKTVPKTPGVYFLKDSQKRIIYIGKARNLRNRVRSYFQPYPGLSGTRENLADEISGIDWRKTESEIEALLLESQFIKKVKPRYNVLMRDDKNYFFVGFSKEDFPRIFITHQPDKTLYPNLIGPFTDGKAIKKTLRILRGIFPYYISKKHPRVKCTYCHIGLCPGPNPSRAGYQKNIRNIKEVLKGKRTGLLRKLGTEMKKASKNKRFEKAAELRDTIAALENTFQHATVLTPDSILGTSEDELSRRKHVYVRSRTSYSELFKKYLRIKLPQQKEFRIEGYDISNIQGKHATGSMVVFTLRGSDPRIAIPAKDEYRKFRIKTVKGANDVAMLKEVLKRRLKHGEWPLPNLILIDGGKPQLNAALTITKGGQSPFTWTVPRVIALAKREEEIYVSGRKTPILLPKTSPLLLLCMRIRDEAHRFAIGYYRTLHGKGFSEN